MKFSRLIIPALVFLLCIPSVVQGGLSDNPQVIMETSKGTIVLEVFPDEAPETVKNFLRYVRWGHYDGTIFHRVIPDFMIQGGGFTRDMQRKTTEMPVQNEANNGLKNDRGTVAMARTPDPHSATDQFFINTKSNSFLDHKDTTAQGWGYAVFGKVVKGMDVVDAISDVKTAKKGMMSDVPVEPVTIIKMTVKE
ncbi:MAG: peptidyl-prolyl cis-trans isomerase [Deltaproteobacteria bacterium]|nr:peptidyl-prolyl cis-trans isomerase [Deltaproteobacteria bacterium]